MKTTTARLRPLSATATAATQPTPTPVPTPTPTRTRSTASISIQTVCPAFAHGHAVCARHHHSVQLTSPFTCNTIKKHRQCPTSITRAALSTHLFRAAAAAATLSFANLISPISTASFTASAQLDTQIPALDAPHYVVSGTSGTLSSSEGAPLRVNATPSSVVGVSKSSIHDYRSSSSSSLSSTSPAATATAATIHSSADSAAKGEFMLAMRLITAVMMGVMLGVERSATSLRLGIRSITVISLSSAIFSLFLTYSELLFMPTTQSVGGYSQLAFGIASNMTPVATALMLACVSSVLVYVVMRVKCFYYKQKHFGAKQKISSNVSLVKSMSAVIGLSVGMGVACGAGLGLMTAGFYLGGVAVMRSDHTAQHQQHAKSISKGSPTTTTSQRKSHLEQQLKSSNDATGEEDEHSREDMSNTRRPAVDSLL